MLEFRRGLALATLFLVTNGPVASGAETDPLLRGTFGRRIFRYLADYSSTLTREQRISLATHVPGLFGFRFVCMWKPEIGEQIAVIPGDTVESQGKGKLACPDGVEVQLEEKSRMVIRQIGDLGEAALLSGAMTVRFGKLPMAVSGGGLLLTMTGKSVLQQIAVRSEKEQMVFLCERGNLEAEMVGEVAAFNNYLASRGCRMEVSGDPDATTTQVLSGDVVQVLNRAVSRNFRPDLSAILGTRAPPPISLWADGSSKFQFAILTLGAANRADCALMVENNPGKPASLVKAFSVEKNQGSIELESIAKGQGYFLVCEDTTGAWASSMYTKP